LLKELFKCGLFRGELTKGKLPPISSYRSKRIELESRLSKKKKKGKISLSKREKVSLRGESQKWVYQVTANARS